MNGVVQSLEDRIGGVRGPWRIGAVDVALVSGFVLFGQLSHGADPIADPIGTLETVLPFAAGWIVVAPLVEAYADDALGSPGRAARIASVGWIAAANVGLILRSSPLFEGGAPWPFNLVMTGVGLVVLVAWRVGYAVVSGS